MKLLLGKQKTGKHFNNILAHKAEQTREVLAAVCYVNHVGGHELFEWCKENDIPLTFYGSRQKDTIATDILVQFATLGYGANSRCRFITGLHSKIVFFRGVGVYLGSSNLTEAGLWSNIEAGIWLDEDDICEDMKRQLETFFLVLESKHRHPRNGEKQSAFVNDELEKNQNSGSGGQKE